METPAQRLKAARKLKGFNQNQLASETRIDQSTISDIENGRGLSAEYLIRLCEALDETPMHIMRGLKTDLSVLAQIKNLVSNIPISTDKSDYLQGKTLGLQTIKKPQDERAKPGISLAASGPGLPKKIAVTMEISKKAAKNVSIKTKRVQK